LRGKQQTLDVLSEAHVERPLFSAPENWEKTVSVKPNTRTELKFVIASK
jgi:hypothetical protein